MPDHQYSPQEALETLMRKINERSKELAIKIQEAIDAGKDVSEVEWSIDRRKKAHEYRKAVPFTHEEALQIALDALQAYFVEQPHFVDSAELNLKKAAVGVPSKVDNFWTNKTGEEKVFTEREGQEKEVLIELHTETQLKKVGDETITLRSTPKDQIGQQIIRIRDLRELTDF